MGDLDFRTIIAFAAIPSTTMLGCVAAYVYSDQKGLKSSTKFLADLFPNRSSVFYLRADFVMSVLIGTCIAIILYSPTHGLSGTCCRSRVDGGIQYSKSREAWKQTE